MQVICRVWKLESLTVGDWCVLLFSAEQRLDEKLTTAVDDIAKSLPSQHQSRTRSELLHKLREHSLPHDLSASSASFACVLMLSCA